MSAIPEPLECSVREGRFVDPCGTLEAMTDTPHAGFSKRKGIARWHYTNLDTHEPSRTFFGAKSLEHPNGMLFNHCPFCGVNISAPFMDKDEPATIPSDQGSAS